MASLPMITALGRATSDKLSVGAGRKSRKMVVPAAAGASTVAEILHADRYAAYTLVVAARDVGVGGTCRRYAVSGMTKA